MQRFMLKSKLHRAIVTDADLHYEGSISIDEHLMEAADLLPYEKVEIYNISNGERFSTYVDPRRKRFRDHLSQWSRSKKGIPRRPDHYRQLCHDR